MPFVLAQCTYPTVSSLTTELIQRYEKNLVPEDTLVDLNISTLTPLSTEELKELMTFMVNPARLRLFQLHVLNPSNAPSTQVANQQLKRACYYAQLQYAAIRALEKKEKPRVNPAKIDFVLHQHVKVPTQILHIIPIPNAHTALPEPITPHPTTQQGATLAPLEPPTYETYQLLRIPPCDLTAATFESVTRPDVTIDHLLQFLKECHSPYQKDIQSRLENLSDPTFYPVFAHLLLLGGDAYLNYVLKLIKILKDKKMSVAFMKQGIPFLKNLQKLTELPQDKQAWWNSLMLQHLQDSTQPFDFNTCFHAYTQTFLPKMAALGIPHLTYPCPITNSTNFLSTLDYIPTLLAQAKKQGETTLHEQYKDLTHLNWSETGAYYAVTQGQFGYVNAQMDLNTAEDTQLCLDGLDPNQPLSDAVFARLIGRYWKDGLTFTQINEIKEQTKVEGWSPLSQQHLLFLITCSFAAPESLSASAWKTQLSEFITELNTYSEDRRAQLLAHLVHCHQFKPHPPSLPQLRQILQLILTVADADIPPIMLCNIHDGQEVMQRLRMRFEKERGSPLSSPLSTHAPTSRVLSAGASDVDKILDPADKPRDVDGVGVDNTLLIRLPSLLVSLRTDLLAIFLDQTRYFEFTQLLASLSPEDWQPGSILALAKTMQDAPAVLLSALSQLNLSKSSHYPCVRDLHALRDTLSNAHLNNTDLTTLTQRLNDQNLLPGCVFGNGQLSQLNDLIIEAIKDFFEKNDEKFPTIIENGYDSHFANQTVCSKLATQITPYFKETISAINQLKLYIRKPSVTFDRVLEHIKTIEDSLDNLFNQHPYEQWLPFKTYSATGSEIFKALIKGEGSGGILGLLSALHPLYKLGRGKLEARYQTYLEKFSDHHSIMVVFEDEIIARVKQPIAKLLHQLQAPTALQDAIFEAIKPNNLTTDTTLQADKALILYNEKIQQVRSFLDKLILFKNKPGIQADEFNQLTQQLALPGLQRLPFQQQHALFDALIGASSHQHLLTRLALMNDLLAQAPSPLSIESIERAIHQLPQLFKLPLDAIQQNKFLKASFLHNLKSPLPFPFEPIIKLHTLTTLEEQTKKELLKQFILFLQAPEVDIRLLTTTIEMTSNLLATDPTQEQLVFSLLKRLDISKLDEELSHYQALLNPNQAANIKYVITRLATSEDPHLTLSLLTTLRQQLIDVPARLEIIYPLFLNAPYPSATMLKEAFKLATLDELKSYCLKFDLNPFLNPGEERPLHLHFAEHPTADTLRAIQDLNLEHPISYSLQIKLAQQLTYIDTLGYNNWDASRPSLIHARREELKTQARILLSNFREQTLDPTSKEYERQQLQLLALLREIYCRTIKTTTDAHADEGLFPHRTQMLTLLLSFHHAQNLLMRIGTGEGKSLLAPLLTILQWIKGGSVDGCTSDPDLLERDYHDNCEPFFQFFTRQEDTDAFIPCSLIRTDSKRQTRRPGGNTSSTYKINGVNFSTLKEMGLFRMIAQLENEPINPGGKTHAVLDEVDAQLLDILSMLCIGGLADSSHPDHPLAWLFPLVHEFIYTEGAQKIDENAWPEDEDLEQLQHFISTHPEVDKEKIHQLDQLFDKDKHLKTALKAAWRAQELKEDEDYILQPKTEIIDGVECVTKIDIIPTDEANSVFVDGVHPALLAKLKHEQPLNAPYFRISPTPSILAYQSIQNLIYHYLQSGGRLIGISGTLGSPYELIYLASVYGIDALSLPAHVQSKRQIHAPQYVTDPTQTLAAICKTIETIRAPFSHTLILHNPAESTKTLDQQWAQGQPPPIAILTKNIKETRVYAKAIQDWCQTHATPVCFIVSDPHQLEAFKERVLQASSAQSQPSSSREQRGISNQLAQSQYQEIPRYARDDGIKIMQSSSDPALFEKLRKQGYRIESVTGNNTTEDIQKRLRQASYQVQFVTGKETREELKQLVQRAGDPNVITIGPKKKLSRGIDIKNQAKHPKGLCLIPTSKKEHMRLEEQGFGRVARQGEPGHVYPIYEVEAPTHWFKKALFYLIPSYRNHYIKQQDALFNKTAYEDAAAERLYTQRIDTLQSALIAQFDAWAQVFLAQTDHAPDDGSRDAPDVGVAQLLHWRQSLLSEVRNHVASTVTPNDVEEKITDFELQVCELWDQFKTNTLFPYSQAHPNPTPAQTIGFSYLSTLSLKNELLVSSPLTQSPPTPPPSPCVSEQTLEMILANHAGSILAFEGHQLDPAAKQQLLRAQTQQLLPYFIYEICTRFPHAIDNIQTSLLTGEAAKDSILKALFSELRLWIKKLSKRVSHVISFFKQLFSQEERPASNHKFEKKQNRIKQLQAQLQANPNNLPAILTCIQKTLTTEAEKASTLNQKFELQHLMLTFAQLRNPSSTPDERTDAITDPIATIEQTFRTQLMRQIAEELIKKLAWAKDEPQSYFQRPIDINLEREEVIHAATIIYQAADSFCNAVEARHPERSEGSPETGTRSLAPLGMTFGNDTANATQTLYHALQKQAHLLKPLFICSLGHTNPRSVIQDALDAIDVLTIAPIGCEQGTRHAIHDTTLIEIHLDQFNAQLKIQSQTFSTSKRWHALLQRINAITKQSGIELGTLLALQACVARFQKNPRYQPDLTEPLQRLHQQLSASVFTLTQPGVLKSTSKRLSSAFLEKTSANVTTLLHATHPVHIKAQYDGLKEYIDVQLSDPALIEENETATQSQHHHYVTSPETRRLLDTQAQQLSEDAALLNTALSQPQWNDTIRTFIPTEHHHQLDELIDLQNQGIHSRYAPKGGSTLDTFRQIDWNDAKQMTEQAQHPLMKSIPSELLTQLTANEKAVRDYTATEQRNQSSGYFTTKIALPARESFFKEKQGERARLIHQLKAAQQAILKTAQDELQHQVDNAIAQRKHTLTPLATAQLQSRQAAIDSYQEKESKKSQYTTLRFFCPAEFFAFQARLEKETELVQDDPVEHELSFFSKIKRQICGDPSTPPPLVDGMI
ncbi:MAG: hypothetical protein NTW08_08480 [Gammaproteobacteria bacterium]|nr:hypothetical protein [Gammaproteobacteria bacterium]